MRRGYEPEGLLEKMKKKGGKMSGP